MKATIWVGKNGCTEDLAEEVKRQLEARKVIKVKWLQNVEMTSEDVVALAKLTSADVLAFRGKIAVLGAKNRKKSEPAPQSKKSQPKRRIVSKSSRRQPKNAYWR
ncbi:MAG TPA: YhbY family RNA-binding protein [Methanocorpusculum sp.]|nr:YhbY family RNA-binding protein [Methanocorpusculum sp.]HJJ57750.1 YhbY family RNA-binding protein [Methanocorpusculum sp.]